MFTPAQHRKTALFLKTAYMQTQHICCLIMGVYPRKNRLYAAAAKLQGGPGNPLCDLWLAMEFVAYSELPAKDAGEMYFFNGREGDYPADLLGVPDFFNHQDDIKLLRSAGYNPDKFLERQMLVMWLFFYHIAEQLGSLSGRIEAAYSRKHKAAKLAGIATGAVLRLLFLLETDPGFIIPEIRPVFEIEELEMFEINLLEELITQAPQEAGK